MKLTLLALSISIFASFAQASAPACESLFKVDKSALVDAYLTAKYPNLKFITADPDQFIADMRHRFDQQKKIDPSNPHGFDYTEVGMPGVIYAQEHLAPKIESLREQRANLETLLNSKHPWNRLFKNKFRRQIQELTVGIRYLKELQVEANEIADSGHISYQRSVEFLYFFARAIGHFDTRKMPFMQRSLLKIDRKMQGYEQLSILSELRMYHENRFSIFQNESNVDGFIAATKPFASAFEDKTELKTILVPSAEPIERDILMRMMTKNINIVGVTADPIGADGFLRPGGDFWIHDVRHESAKFAKRILYMLKHQPTDAQVEALDTLQEEWMVDLHHEILAIKDKNLREAVSLIIFNFNHDRGFPMLPSEWLFRKPAFAAHGLVLMLTISGQGTGYWLPITNSYRARNWITEFWSKRLAEENRALGGD